MNKKTMKVIINVLSFAAVFAFAFIMASPHFAFAADPSTAYTQAGIGNSSGDASSTSLYSSLKNIIYIIMAVGGFWVIACLLFAGMKLSASQGNPQARTAGFIGLAMACLGLFVIVKAYDIAGWVASFGAH